MLQNLSIEHTEERSNQHEAEVRENDAPIEELQNKLKELKESKKGERRRRSE